MYYPLSEITENLYTSGFEFIDLQTGTYYTGYYFSTTDGKYYTGKTISETSVEIVPAKEETSSYYATGFNNSVPNPTDEDYQKGYFTRYLIKRVNSSIETMLEVSKEDYEKSKQNPLYLQVMFDWKITGSLYDDMSNPLYPIYGVLSTNQSTVSNLEPQMPEISNFYKNYAEFYK